MKLIASILIIYFTTLVIAPMPCAIASFVERNITCEYANDDGTCNESSDCPEDNECNSENHCSTSLCCNLQCCNCYFMHQQQLKFALFSDVNTKYAFPENDKITSTFSGECWQPPELI